MVGGLYLYQQKPKKAHRRAFIRYQALSFITKR